MAMAEPIDTALEDDRPDAAAPDLADVPDAAELLDDRVTLLGTRSTRVDATLKWLARHAAALTAAIAVIVIPVIIVIQPTPPPIQRTAVSSPAATAAASPPAEVAGDFQPAGAGRLEGNEGAGPCGTGGIQIDPAPAAQEAPAIQLEVPEGGLLATAVDTGWGQGSIVVARTAPGSTSSTVVATYRGVAPQDPLGLSVIGWSSSSDAVLVRAAEDGPAAGKYSCAALYSVDSEGSGATRLPATGPGSWIPVAVPAAESGQVAFVQDGELRTVDAWSSDVGRTFGDCPAAGSLRWSPDETSILAVCGDSLTVLQTQGVSLPFREDPAGVPLAAAWSPDGASITLVTARQAPEGFEFGPLTVFDIDLRTRVTTRRLETEEQAAWAEPSPAISPNGRWLVTEAKVLRHNDFTPYAVDLTTGAATELPWPVFNGVVGEAHFGWLPDGNTLLEADSGTIYAVNLEQMTRVAVGNLPAASFAWLNAAP
jgi:hypothetical protein